MRLITLTYAFVNLIFLTTLMLHDHVAILEAFYLALTKNTRATLDPILIVLLVANWCFSISVLTMSSIRKCVSRYEFSFLTGLAGGIALVVTLNVSSLIGTSLLFGSSLLFLYARSATDIEFKAENRFP